MLSYPIERVYEWFCAVKSIWEDGTEFVWEKGLRKNAYPAYAPYSHHIPNQPINYLPRKIHIRSTFSFTRVDGITTIFQ